MVLQSSANATTTASLADSLPTIINSARQVREQEGVMTQLVERHTLGRGMGLSWNEVAMDQLTAQAVTETTVLDNPQQITDTLFVITPSVVQVQTFITDRVRLRIARVAFRQIGSLAQNAITRRKDEDGLVVVQAAAVALGGAGTTLVSGHIAAGVSRISSDATEPGNPPYHCVLHGFQLKDIYSELTAAVGTAEITTGLTARVFRERFRGQISSAKTFEDGNIAIDGNTDAEGGVFAKEAIVMIQGRAPKVETRREPHIGGGGDSMFHGDEHAYGERSAGNWLYSIQTDATLPTS